MFVLPPYALKIAKFYRQGESETLSLIICLLIAQHHKFSKLFAKCNTHKGYCGYFFVSQISAKQNLFAIGNWIERFVFYSIVG